MRIQDLFEYKVVYDYRHDMSDLPYFPKKDDPQYIHPTKGFHFQYYKGELQLSSTDNVYYSKQVVGDTNGNTIWNQFGGMVDIENKTIKIAKTSVNNSYRQTDIPNIKEVKKCFSELKSYGVDGSFKISGLPSQYPKTVGEIMNLVDPTDASLTNETLFLYHGTSLSRWDKIKRYGLHPGNTPDSYNDLIPGYSEYNVYLCASEKVADFYGKRQATKDDDDQYVVLKIQVPDNSKLLPDDRFYYNKTKGFSLSGRNLGEFAYRGKILPIYIKNAKIKKRGR